jgi:signal transduction histidine kinase
MASEEGKSAFAGSEFPALVAEQAALRRVATLVAGGVPSEKVFAAVVEEIGGVLAVASVGMGRYEDGRCIAVAAWGGAVAGFPVGSEWTPEGTNLVTIVFETTRSARIDEYGDASGPVGIVARETGFRSAVGAPITVDGRLWGLVIAASIREPPLPPDTEARLADFTALAAMAIANAQSRAELTASRARIVAAGDQMRRRIERDLHDGAQQRLVQTVITLKLALRALANSEADAGALVHEALDHAEQATAELRELAHGILPAPLTRGGLRAGIAAVVSRASLPVTVDVSVGRLPAVLEATAYFVISEALANVDKHARANHATVTARVDRGELRLEIHDDGIGGARVQNSTGLRGLQDRVSALDGRLVVTSPPDAGTSVRVVLPVPGDD